ncbi:MAG TPA: pyridoxal 5'-phosphate synthase glutaminase subunit PdxT [Dehalococcoidia bacterium]|nr:pyridoxal 5'-phosphate synthase glutaminase subunit PdxT [Dehalococcoidia bacterium]
MFKVGVLALQGDFLEHQQALERLGQQTVQVRKPQDLLDLDALVMPGGESTTFCRLMADFGLYEPLRDLLSQGLPVWGTCAGMIVLARTVLDLPFPTLGVLDIVVDRNAYGRQVDSFETDLAVPALGPDPVRAVFIRAPVVVSVGEGVEVLARLPDGPDVPPAGAGTAVAVRQGHVLATTFHPELTDDLRFHRLFLDMVSARQARPV